MYCIGVGFLIKIFFKYWNEIFMKIGSSPKRTRLNWVLSLDMKVWLGRHICFFSTFRNQYFGKEAFTMACMASLVKFLYGR
jgi:hypothetical protein